MGCALLRILGFSGLSRCRTGLMLHNLLQDIFTGDQVPEADCFFKERPWLIPLFQQMERDRSYP